MDVVRRSMQRSRRSLGSREGKVVEGHDQKDSLRTESEVKAEETLRAP